VDIDQVSSVAYAEKITAMPTFVGYFNGKRINDIVGADKDALEKMIIELGEKRNLNIDELRAMSIKEVKSLCRIRNVPTRGCIEKEELVQKLLNY
jgi:thioredoxin-like negative regulator of GroEL